MLHASSMIVHTRKTHLFCFLKTYSTGSTIKAFMADDVLFHNHNLNLYCFPRTITLSVVQISPFLTTQVWKMDLSNFNANQILWNIPKLSHIRPYKSSEVIVVSLQSNGTWVGRACLQYDKISVWQDLISLRHTISLAHLEKTLYWCLLCEFYLITINSNCSQNVSGLN